MNHLPKHKNKIIQTPHQRSKSREQITHRAQAKYRHINLYTMSNVSVLQELSGVASDKCVYYSRSLLRYDEVLTCTRPATTLQLTYKPRILDMVRAGTSSANGKHNMWQLNIDKLSRVQSTSNLRGLSSANKPRL